MFGLVKRERLLECEKSRVKLKLENFRLEQRIESAQEALAKMDSDLDLARKQIEMLEADRKLLLEAAAARGPVAQADGGEEEARPRPRSLTFLEVAARATEHRNRHSEAAGAPGPTVFQMAGTQARERRLKAGEKS